MEFIIETECIIKNLRSKFKVILGYDILSHVPNMVCLCQKNLQRKNMSMPAQQTESRHDRPEKVRHNKYQIIQHIKPKKPLMKNGLIYRCTNRQG